MSEPIEHQVTVRWSGLTLAGTLRTPPAPAPSPAVLLLPGSGPSDRDGNGYFRPIIRALTDRGLAALALDKPGCGESTGDWREHALRDRAAQAGAAIDALRRHPAVSGDRIGVFGHSQGGWLVQMLAADRDDLCFAVASSGPSITVAEQDLFAVEHRMRADGLGDREVADAVAYVTAVHRAAVEGLAYPEVESAVLGPARRQPWYRYHPIVDEPDWRLTTLLVAEPFEPMESLARIRCPFLAVYGGADVLVPAWRSAEESGRALAEAGNPDATVVVFPGADHRIQWPGTGRLVPGYLDLLAGWAADRAGAVPVS